MGSCFSKRKKSDAAVTHNASPRSSFSLSCKSDVVTTPSPLRVHKSNDEIAVVMSKDSAPLLTNTQNSHSLKKNQSAKAIYAQKLENAKTDLEEKGRNQQSVLQGTQKADSDGSSVQKMEKDKLGDHEETFVNMKLPNELASLQYGDGPKVSTNAKAQQTCATNGEDVLKRCTVTPIAGIVVAPAIGSNKEDKEMLLSIDDEFGIEADDPDNVLPSSLAKLKRSRSCDETIRLPETKRPPGRRSFQETSTFSPRAARLETIPEPPHFGTTKYLEGLDLVDVLPHRLSNSDNQNGALLGVEEELKPALLDLSQHESHGLTADFFALKNRYLSSCALSSQNALCSIPCPEADDGKVSAYSGSDAEDDVTSSFGLMHSRASSLDSGEHMGMVSMYSSSCRYPIPVVEEEDEDECGSDDSETFEFKHAVSMHEVALNQKRPQLRTRVADEEEEEMERVSSCRPSESEELSNNRGGKGSTRVKELSVVATGDALLYTGNSEEFDLIPSKSYVRGSPKQIHSTISDIMPPDQRDYYACLRGLADDDHEKQQQNSLSVDDIILMLEKDELDEDVLLSFLNLAKSTTETSHGGGSTPSCQASDVASEASFEFKIKSPGSTPHSTPSTPMLSAGSTPKRINQLSPLVLTSEEIAEIWGVFEQRQALSPFQMCEFP